MRRFVNAASVVNTQKHTLKNGSFPFNWFHWWQKAKNPLIYLFKFCRNERSRIGERRKYSPKQNAHQQINRWFGWVEMMFQFPSYVLFPFPPNLSSRRWHVFNVDMRRGRREILVTVDSSVISISLNSLSIRNALILLKRKRCKQISRNFICVGNFPLSAPTFNLSLSLSLSPFPLPYLFIFFQKQTSECPP